MGIALYIRVREPRDMRVDSTRYEPLIAMGVPERMSIESVSAYMVPPRFLPLGGSIERASEQHHVAPGYVSDVLCGWRGVTPRFWRHVLCDLDPSPVWYWHFLLNAVDAQPRQHWDQKSVAYARKRLSDTIRGPPLSVGDSLWTRWALNYPSASHGDIAEALGATEDELADIMYSFAHVSQRTLSRLPVLLGMDEAYWRRVDLRTVHVR